MPLPAPLFLFLLITAAPPATQPAGTPFTQLFNSEVSSLEQQEQQRRRSSKDLLFFAIGHRILHDNDQRFIPPADRLIAAGALDQIPFLESQASPTQNLYPFFNTPDESALSLATLARLSNHPQARDAVIRIIRKSSSDSPQELLTYVSLGRPADVRNILETLLETSDDALIPQILPLYVAIGDQVSLKKLSAHKPRIQKIEYFNLDYYASFLEKKLSLPKIDCDQWGYASLVIWRASIQQPTPRSNFDLESPARSAATAIQTQCELIPTELLRYHLQYGDRLTMILAARQHEITLIPEITRLCIILKKEFRNSAYYELATECLAMFAINQSDAALFELFDPDDPDWNRHLTHCVIYPLTLYRLLRLHQFLTDPRYQTSWPTIIQAILTTQRIHAERFNKHAA